MIHFRVEGPFEIEPFHGASGKLIEKTAIDKFWADEDKSHLADAIGCYIFGFRAGKGSLPVYVGQSKTGFKHECFQYHKLSHYNTEMVKRQRGTPIMFFVVKDSGATSAFEACIDRVESLLIQYALRRNPELANVHIGDWSIQGVYGSSLGKPSNSAILFRKLLGIEIEEDGVQGPISDKEKAPGTTIVSTTAGDIGPQTVSTTQEPSSKADKESPAPDPGHSTFPSL